jgi:hypothetical protein
VSNDDVPGIGLKTAAFREFLARLRDLPIDDAAWEEVSALRDVLGRFAENAALAREQRQRRSELVAAIVSLSAHHRVAEGLRHKVIDAARLPADLNVGVVQPRVVFLSERYASIARLSVSAVENLYPLMEVTREANEGYAALQAVVPAACWGPPTREASAPATAPSPPPRPTVPASVPTSTASPAPAIPKPAKASPTPTSATASSAPTAATPPPVAVRAPPPAHFGAITPPRKLTPKLPSKGKLLKNVRVCFDFGTARSKATMMLNDTPSVLAIGKASGSGQDFSIASSMWFGDERLVFGDRAIEQSLSNRGAGRRRLDSMKLRLFGRDGRGEGGGEDALLPEDLCGPHVRFTAREAIVLFLGFQTWAVERAMFDGGLRGEVPRRYALPGWRSDTFRTASASMQRLLQAATVLARSVPDEEWRDGLRLQDAHALARQAVSLTDEGASLVPAGLFDDAVAEQIAAANPISHELSRAVGPVMVIDIGAGTTDFGLFLAQPREDALRLVEVGRHSIAVAGNVLDEALREQALAVLAKAANRALSEAEKIEVELNQRLWKEQVFSAPRVRVSLVSGLAATITRNDFLALPRVGEFVRQIKSGIEVTLEEAESRASTGQRVAWEDYPATRVVLTGGGANLPMIRDLARGPFATPTRSATLSGRASVEANLVTTTPAGLRNAGIQVEAYPPFAVSWGGAMESLPAMGGPTTLRTVALKHPDRGTAGYVPVSASSTWQNEPH